jgi:hypothetical protein
MIDPGAQEYLSFISDEQVISNDVNSALPTR